MSFQSIVQRIIVVILLFSCSVSKKNKSSDFENTRTVGLVKPDSSKNINSDSLKRNKPGRYKDIITEKSISDRGLFTVHKTDERYFFEVPDSLLDRDILIVSRISKGAADFRPGDGIWGYAGDEIGERVIRFSKGPKDRLFIKSISFWERAVDSSENGLYRTVSNSNFLPIIATFDIKAYAPDSLGTVIDVTEFLNSDNSVLYFGIQFKKWYGLGGLQKDKSYIASIQSFPINVELQAVNTYVFGETTLTYELNASFVLLPKDLMQPRYMDQRVGYFSRSYVDFDFPQNVQSSSMIIRRRLEPKDADKDRYLKGELVEPENPIVYYIDPATPKKWIPYLIQGVNDWQKSFEKAGFKNAIYALEAPTDNPTFSLFDARHSAIVYKPSVIANASGPIVHDPRTGEILETHVNWYHNVMQLLHDWYMVQAGPNDPRARNMIFADSLMGQLIRFAVSHEVGHTLGLMHNFGASSTVPVDSLRNRNYVERNGFCPSIMDYARFNYVAQPEDGFSEKGLFPKIGVYDEWAIEWGYKWLPQLKTREEQKAFMNKWIINTLAKDKRLWYGPQILGGTDPRCQSEDLGDDAIKASNYGIENLKELMLHLKEWTKEPNEDFRALQRMENEVINQYYRYVMHVASNIGPPTWTAKSQEQAGNIMGFIPREKQKRAVEFLNNQLFNPPLWLNNMDIFPLIGGPGPFVHAMLQTNVFNSILSYGNFTRMESVRIAYPDNSYTFNDLLNDLEKDVWKELRTEMPINFYRRNLQKVYIERLIELAAAKEVRYRAMMLSGDFISICQSHLRNIMKQINKAKSKYKDEASRMHLFYMANRLQQALDASAFLINSTGTNPAGFDLNRLEKGKGNVIGFNPNYYENWRDNLKCWQNDDIDFLRTGIIYFNQYFR